jgi:hypothetical protein
MPARSSAGKSCFRPLAATAGAGKLPLVTPHLDLDTTNGGHYQKVGSPLVALTHLMYCLFQMG